jgi:hypothetical protein
MVLEKGKMPQAFVVLGKKCRESPGPWNKTLSGWKGGERKYGAARQSAYW